MIAHLSTVEEFCFGQWKWCTLAGQNPPGPLLPARDLRQARLMTMPSTKTASVAFGGSSSKSPMAQPATVGVIQHDSEAEEDMM